MTDKIKDIDQEEKKKETEDVKEAKAIKKSSWGNVPLAFKIIGFVFLYLKYNEITSRNGNLSELWVYVIMVGVVWYFLGMDYKLQDTGILTPKQAYDKVVEEVAVMRKDGRIKYNQKAVINPVQNLSTHEAIPTYYIFSLLLVSADGVVRKYKVMVSAKGETKGFVYVTKSPVEIRGEEVEHTKVIVPNWIKDADKYPALGKMFGLGK